MSLSEHVVAVMLLCFPCVLELHVLSMLVSLLLLFDLDWHRLLAVSVPYK